MARKIRVFVQTNVSGSKCEDEQDCPDDWDEMSAEDKQAYLSEVAQSHLQNFADYGAYLVEDGDDNE